MYSGENVLIVAPDSDNLSVISAALSTDEPDSLLPLHDQRFHFRNGEVRKLIPVVKLPTLSVTGQTVEEGRTIKRKVAALRLADVAKRVDKTSPTWTDLWHMSVDNS